MNNDQLNYLIDNIQRLQISWNQTQTELNTVRTQLREATEGAPARQEGAQAPRVEEREGLQIGDTVRILNGVRLSGMLRNSRNVQGIINRFTGTYVIVRVNLQGVGRYQDVRRAFHNVERLSRSGQ